MPVLDPGQPLVLAERAHEAFAARFGAPPAIVARAPGRVNLIGEHTDYNRGLCLPVALPHSTYAAVRPRADDEVRLTSLQVPDGYQGRLSELGPGRLSGWSAYVGGVLWALRDAGYAVPGVDVLVDSTVPVGAGLSSSAALECATALAVTTLLGLEDTHARRAELVTVCMRAETEVAGAPTGGLDQSISLFGEHDAALLLDFAEGSRRVVPTGFPAAGLSVLVVDTRVSHALVDGGYAARRDDCRSAAAELGLDSLREATEPDLERVPDERLRRRARHVVTEIARVRQTVVAMGTGDWAEVGRLFDDSHASLRDDYEVSCLELYVATAAARAGGALGARMTGGGFGGSAIALAPVAALEEVGSAVTLAFEDRGFGRPNLLVADAGPGADVVWSAP